MYRVINHIDFPNVSTKRQSFIEDLNKLPELCWANLVMWSLGYYDFPDLIEDGVSCDPDDPYCGKCAREFPVE